MAETVTLWVYRGDQHGGEEKPYEVPLMPGMVVLDAVHWIQAHLAPDLAVRWNCKAAHCGSCSAEVNGRPRLLCKTRLDEFVKEGVPVHVRPMKTFPIIKDLVTDVSWNYRVMRQIPPFQPREPAPFTLYQRDVDRVQEFRRCIECFLCQDVCHVLREHHEQEHYFGPRFMARLAELEMHPMDAGDRVGFIRETAGVGWCNITHCCAEVCPEAIEITNNAIIPLKERVADRYWDPIRGLFRRFQKTAP
ncbi:MAG: succinate dehydrogenase/fumarate reductase iron-sulfur subunit [Firmicutes bacterium]|nr:succinate dehydrogenase/fumarate reductase iron-sulfur subunit [Alicyclobacillaceae bacterium]MCL6496514.1 succinate dehydrogenase/fumarate reductase iron-sulfur subunit [Bacillota bacterium]